jgi:hypothetical protein
MRILARLIAALIFYPVSRALSLDSPILGTRNDQAGLGWHFVQNGSSGVIALESIVVSDTLAIFFNRATQDPLQIDGHSAWGALWNMDTNTASSLNLISDTFCASGGFLSNGTMVRPASHQHWVHKWLIRFSGQRRWKPA